MAHPSRRAQKGARLGMTQYSKSKALIQRGIARPVAAGFVLDENLGDLRMPDRLAGIVGQKVLLRNIGDVFGLRVLGEQVIERLVLVRANVLRDRKPPFLGV